MEPNRIQFNLNISNHEMRSWCCEGAFGQYCAEKYELQARDRKTKMIDE